MRGLVPELRSPHPIGQTLPLLFQEDLFAQDLCAGLDAVLAPIFATLDSLPAYLDPATAPDDMLGWLAGWLGLALDVQQAPQRQRQLVRAGMELLSWRGTARGISQAVEAIFQIRPVINESGGSSFAVGSNSPLPGTSRPFFLVRLPVPDPAAFDLRRLDAVVASVKPAHIPHRVEVFTRQ